MSALAHVSSCPPQADTFYIQFRQLKDEWLHKQGWKYSEEKSWGSGGQLTPACIYHIHEIMKADSTKPDGKLQRTTQNFPWFGVSFYSAFLVADKVIVTSKHNNDTQHIWELDSSQFLSGPRGNTQRQGTTIVLVSNEEASDYLELDKTKNLLQRYSQFINFPMYMVE